VADAHLGSDLKAMLSEIERAYQTSDRGSDATAAAFAFRPPATAHSLPTPAPPPQAFAAPPALLALNGRPDAVREVRVHCAHQRSFAWYLHHRVSHRRQRGRPTSSRSSRPKRPPPSDHGLSPRTRVRRQGSSGCLSRTTDKQTMPPRMTRSCAKVVRSRMLLVCFLRAVANARLAAQAMEELLNGHDSFSNLHDDNEENA
jgi:hypothetical protein